LAPLPLLRRDWKYKAAARAFCESRSNPMNTMQRHAQVQI